MKILIFKFGGIVGGRSPKFWPIKEYLLYFKYFTGWLTNKVRDQRKVLIFQNLIK